MADGTGRPVIVAGVDGSEDSKEALRWAVGEARRTGGEVHAVIAWEAPVATFFVPSYTEDDYRHDAEVTLKTALTETLTNDPGVPVIVRAVERRPPVALVEESANAELLVIGSHGCGEFTGLHLGSVASYCVRQALCPVVVVCHRRAAA